MNEFENENLKNEINKLNKFIDSICPSIERQAVALRLKLEEPNRKRGSYQGTIVGLDRFGILVMYRREGAIAVSNAELPETQQDPQVGDRIKLIYRDGLVNCSINFINRSYKDNLN